MGALKTALQNLFQLITASSPYFDVCASRSIRVCLLWSICCQLCLLFHVYCIGSHQDSFNQKFVLFCCLFCAIESVAKLILQNFPVPGFWKFVVCSLWCRHIIFSTVAMELSHDHIILAIRASYCCLALSLEMCCCCYVFLGDCCDQNQFLCDWKDIRLS